MKSETNMSLMQPSFRPWEHSKDGFKQIAVLMSGGVDSSVAAYLLKEQGWQVLGITMKIPVACDISRGCCGADAAFVCEKLDIPHYFIDTTKIFKKTIIDKFRNEYAKGRTPNPCVDCNTILKFGLVWDFIEEHFGISDLATGHYAKIVSSPAGSYLCRADDKKKDQSYFLYGIKADRLNNFHLPLGNISKPKVREIAHKINLSVADKPESMELCFAGENDYRTALNQEAANKPGELVDMHDNILGTHKGIANYTLGQRRGLGYAGGEPLYVGRIEAKTNIVSIGKKDEVSFKGLVADELNCLWSAKAIAGASLKAKIRSYAEPQPCIIKAIDGGTMEIEFDQPQFAPCPGQKIVLYCNDTIVVGGTIVFVQN